MILVIIEIGGLVVQELHLANHVGIHGSVQQLCGIETIRVCIHHLRQTGHQLIASVDGHINLCGHRLVTLGLDGDDTISTLGTIEGGTVLEYRDCLDVVDIDISQEVIIITIVEHLTRVLHIHDHIIDNYQRLSVGIE